MGPATGRAICRLVSQESPRLKDKETGSNAEGWSRAMKTIAHQRLFRRKWVGPDENDRGTGRE
jgi:hypothetical protein